MRSSGQPDVARHQPLPRLGPCSGADGRGPAIDLDASATAATNRRVSAVMRRRLAAAAGSTPRGWDDDPPTRGVESPAGLAAAPGHLAARRSPRLPLAGPLDLTADGSP
jgi:hypothetical protein